MRYVVVFLCIFNVVMWMVFLWKFKKLFTTDNVIEETRVQYNNLIADMNKNTRNNIVVIEDRIRSLKALVSDAEKKIKILNDIEKKGYALNEFHEAISGKKSGVTEKKVVDAYKKSKGASNIELDSSVVLSGKARIKSDESEGQGSLFDDGNRTIDTTAKVNVNSKGESWAAVPVVVPKVFVPENPIPRKKDRMAQIVRMYDSGMTAEEIAEELSLTDMEVQFALSLEDRI